MAGIDVARAMGAAFGPGPDQVLYGVVANVGTNTVDVYLGNSATGVSPSAATLLPYLSGYNPAVGDAVCVLHGQGSSKSSFLVLGTVAGSSSGGGSTGVPIGAIQMFPVTITYPNWLLCNGGTFSSATYPVLHALLGSTTLPDLRDTLPMGAHTIVSLGATGGAQTSTGLISHTHGGPSHTHTGPSHSHTDSGHSHGHSHTPSNGTSFTTTASGTIASPGGGGFGFDAVTATDSTSGTANIGSGGTGATGSASGTTGSAGSGSSFSIIPPVLGVAYYIRAA